MTSQTLNTFQQAAHAMLPQASHDERSRQEFAKGLRAEWTLPPKRQQENARLLPMLTP